MFSNQVLKAFKLRLGNSRAPSFQHDVGWLTVIDLTVFFGKGDPFVYLNAFRQLSQHIGFCAAQVDVGNLLCHASPVKRPVGQQHWLQFSHRTRASNVQQVMQFFHLVFQSGARHQRHKCRTLGYLFNSHRAFGFRVLGVVGFVNRKKINCCQIGQQFGQCRIRRDRNTTVAHPLLDHLFTLCTMCKI